MAHPVVSMLPFTADTLFKKLLTLKSQGVDLHRVDLHWEDYQGNEFLIVESTFDRDRRKLYLR